MVDGSWPWLSRGSSCGGRRHPDDRLCDVPLGDYVRAELLPDGRWRMFWRGFDVSVEEAAPAIVAAPSVRVAQSCGTAEMICR